MLPISSPGTPHLLSNSSAQNLCPKEAALRPLNDLLVHTTWRVVHNDRTLLIIDLRINPRVPDQIHDPLLALVLIQAKPRTQILDVDTLMDLAVAL